MYILQKKHFIELFIKCFRDFILCELYHMHKIGQIVSKKEKEMFNTKINLNA